MYILISDPPSELNSPSFITFHCFFFIFFLLCLFRCYSILNFFFFALDYFSLVYYLLHYFILIAFQAIVSVHCFESGEQFLTAKYMAIIAAHRYCYCLNPYVFYVLGYRLHVDLYKICSLLRTILHIKICYNFYRLLIYRRKLLT